MRPALHEDSPRCDSVPSNTKATIMVSHRSSRRTQSRGPWSGVLAVAVVVACSGNNATVQPAAGPTGTSCTAATACYPGLDAGALRGTVTCLTQLQGGYCTHTCQSDTDCCSTPAECPDGFPEVCAPLESASKMYCVLSCQSVPADAGVTDTTTFCQRFANPAFTCRSTGGGANNRKFCGP